MVRQRPALGTPFGSDGPWLNAILDVLGDLHDLLDARLPQAGKDPGQGNAPAPDAPAQRSVVPVSEPAPDRPPAEAEPVAEPDPDDTPEPDEEPAPEADRPKPPPRAGKGSGAAAWRAFADRAGVAYEADMSRDDLIAACELAGAIPGE